MGYHIGGLLVHVAQHLRVFMTYKNFPGKTFLLFALSAALLMLAAPSCARNAETPHAQRENSSLELNVTNDRAVVSSEANSQADFEDLNDDTPIDRGLLSALMGEDEAAKLIEGAETNAKRKWIAAHPDAIGFEGEAVQAKLLTLAADEDEAVRYVRSFADKYPAKSAAESKGGAHSDDTDVPHLYQRDERWGYTVYSSTAFGLTGCGPTALAMVYQGVTGKDDLSPYDMGTLAQEMGHMARFEGTSTSFLYDASSRLGITCESIPTNLSTLKQALDEKKVLVVNMGNGYFSHYDGHYLVVTGIDKDGKLVIYDPYSAVHSQQTWDADFILGQTKGLYAFSAPPDQRSTSSSANAHDA